MKRYAFAPMLLGLFLYGVLGAYMIEQFSQLLDWGVSSIPEWLQFLTYIAWLLFALVGLIIIGYSFAIVAMIICSPFHGLLAEKVAQDLGYRTFDEKLTAAVMYRIAVRSLKREWIKFLYNLPRVIGVLLLVFVLSFIPIINLFAPLIAFLWAAWSMAIQFLDYPADNDQVEFLPMLAAMRKKRAECLWFGGSTAFLLSVPLVNLLTIPAAVAGATKLWIEQIDTGNNDAKPV